MLIMMVMLIEITIKIMNVVKLTSLNVMVRQHMTSIS